MAVLVCCLGQADSSIVLMKSRKDANNEIGGGIGGIGGTILANQNQASNQGQATVGAVSCQSCVGAQCAGCINVSYQPES